MRVLVVIFLSIVFLSAGAQAENENICSNKRAVRIWNLKIRPEFESITSSTYNRLPDEFEKFGYYPRSGNWLGKESAAYAIETFNKLIRKSGPDGYSFVLDYDYDSQEEALIMYYDYPEVSLWSLLEQVQVRYNYWGSFGTYRVESLEVLLHPANTAVLIGMFIPLNSSPQIEGPHKVYIRRGWVTRKGHSNDRIVEIGEAYVSVKYGPCRN